MLDSCPINAASTVEEMPRLVIRLANACRIEWTVTPVRTALDAAASMRVGCRPLIKENARSFDPERWSCDLRTVSPDRARGTLSQTGRSSQYSSARRDDLVPRVSFEPTKGRMA
jgi:hypothetical protein